MKWHASNANISNAVVQTSHLVFAEACDMLGLCAILDHTEILQAAIEDWLAGALAQVTPWDEANIDDLFAVRVFADIPIRQRSGAR